jgi:hypothetical protein
VYLLRQALGATTETGYPVPDIRLDEAEHARGRRVLEHVLASAPAATAHLKTIGVFANATGAKRFARDWWERFLAAVERAAPDCTFIEILPATGKSLIGARYPCFYSSDVRKLAAVMAQLALFLGTDSGVMHLASAAGAPTIGLFCVTDPAEWGPYGGCNRAVVATTCDPEQVAAQVIETLQVIRARHA